MNKMMIAVVIAAGVPTFELAPIMNIPEGVKYRKVKAVKRIQQ